MKLIVGLGNPGFRYRNSRHNIGFAVVVALQKRLKWAFKRDRQVKALVAKGVLAGSELVLAMPLTYMNLSGSAVSELMRHHSLKAAGLLVIHDEVDLALGRLKLKNGGSSGGHRGVQSIIESLSADGFDRLRLGVGRPEGSGETARHVLSSFSRGERQEVREMILKAVDCAEAWAQDGRQKCMNIYNQKE